MSVHKAYERIAPDWTDRYRRLEASLDELLDVAREAESPLLQSMKPTIAVALKWKFDYLAKTFESPFELEEDIAYWIRSLRMLARLGREGWFNSMPAASDGSIDPWTRTAQGFDLGWTTTTEGERFKELLKIAQDRMDQIIAMLGGPGYFAGKEILDSGCGPGRYVDIMRKLGPKRIVGMDQGERLVKAVTERFKDDPLVTMERGTAEKLTYPDNAFDIVFSNGVIHHTPADLPTMLADHARVLRKGGVMFIMLVGKGGLEMKMWEWVRAFLYDVPLDQMIATLRDKVSPYRLQGIVDHMYGEYQQTERPVFEEWCRHLFTRIERVPGIAGHDVTPEIYVGDPYYEPRFGTGHLRYLCYK
jgi:ubiquinone/menaquinone biosynthesis C-methylase UbiE